MTLRHGLTLLALAAGCIKPHAATTPAANPPPRRQAFTGNAVEVTVDLGGWYPRAGAGTILGQHERVALLRRNRGEELSIEVDDPPSLLTKLPELLAEVLEARPGAPAAEAIATERFGDRPAIAISEVTGAGKLARRQLHAALLIADKLVTLSYSAPEKEGALERGRAALEPMVRTLTLRHDGSLFGQRPPADITGDEVFRYASLFGCDVDDQTLACQAILYFREAHAPAPRRTPVALAGIGFVAAWARGLPKRPPGDALAFVVLDEKRVGFGLVPWTNEDEMQSIAQAVMHSQPLPRNDTLARLQGQRDTWPAAQNGSSLIWSDFERGWARENDAGGLFVVAQVPGGVAVGMFPVKQ